MRSLLKNLLLVCFIAYCNNVYHTDAFQCYICDSKVDAECVENLPPDSKIKPQECNNITNAKYCIKTTNLYAGELGTKRFCAANDHGNRCNYVKQPTGDRDYRACVLTCDTENCNGANPLMISSVLYLFGLIFVLYTYILTTNIKTLW